MIAPSIHINGTSGELLLEQQTSAISAIYKALGAMDSASPNGRDYYVQGTDAFRRAQNEHQSRVDSLRKVLMEMNEIAEKIADLIDS